MGSPLPAGKFKTVVEDGFSPPLRGRPLIFSVGVGVPGVCGGPTVPYTISVKAVVQLDAVVIVMKYEKSPFTSSTTYCTSCS